MCGGGANRLAVLAVALALACGQPVLANLYVATNGGGKLSATSQTSYESLRQRAVADGGVVVTVGYVLPGNLGDINTPAGLAAAQAAVLNEIAAFEGRYANVMLGAVVHASLTPVLKVKLSAAGVDQLLTDPNIVDFSELGSLRSQLREVNSTLQTSLLPSMGTAGSSNQMIAVLDSGVGIAQPEFAGRIAAGACFSTSGGDFVTGTPGPLPVLCANSTNTGIAADGAACASSDPRLAFALRNCGHGTHVAGIALGEPNVAGTKGLAPAAKLMVIQTGSVYQTGDANRPYDFQYYTFDLTRALDYVFEHRADGGRSLAAVNMSLGYAGFGNVASCRDPSGSLFMNKAIARLTDTGVAVVAAAGNNPPGIDYGMAYPACLSNVISVGATGRADSATDYSMYGFNNASKVTLLAPGGGNNESYPPPSCTTSSSNTNGICAAKLGGTGGARERRSGTSMSAPVVAGLIARMRDRYPNMSGMQAGALLAQTGVPIVASSPSSTTVTEAIPRVAPVAALRIAGLPRNVSAASTSCGAATVNWSAPLHLVPTGYNLRMAASVSGLGSASASSLGNVQTTALSALNTPMFVQLQAVDARGAGEWSDAVQAVPGPCAPAQVVGLQQIGAVYQCGDLTYLNCRSYQWAVAAGSTQYELEARPTASFTGVANQAPTSAFTATGTLGTFVRVRACATTLCGPWSSTLAIDGSVGE